MRLKVLRRTLALLDAAHPGGEGYEVTLALKSGREITGGIYEPLADGTIKIEARLPGPLAEYIGTMFLDVRDIETVREAN